MSTIYIPRDKGLVRATLTGADTHLQVRTRETRRLPNRLRDDTVRWATHKRGEHAKPSPLRAALRRLAMAIILAACLATGLLLLLASTYLGEEVYRTLALMMSGALFTVFVFGLLDERGRGR